MNIVGSQNDYIRNLVNIISKGKTLSMGTVQYGTLYLLINNGLLYNIQVPDFSNISCSFSEDDFKDDITCIKDNQIVFFNYHMDQIIKSMTTEYNNYQLIYDNPNIRESELFENMINAKSEDGAFRFFIDTSGKRVFVYLQKSMFGLNKSDKCSVRVYKTVPILESIWDCINPTTSPYATEVASEYLAKFNIYKSKLKINIGLSFKFIS